MTEIKNRTEQYLLPFDVTVRDIRAKGLKSDYLDIFISLNKMPPPDAWKKAIFSSKSAFTSDEKQILADFGCSLCICSREQIRSCSERLISEMNQKYIFLTGNKDKNTKMVSALSLTAGLAVVTVLI